MLSGNLDRIELKSVEICFTSPIQDPDFSVNRLYGGLVISDIGRIVANVAPPID